MPMHGDVRATMVLQIRFIIGVLKIANFFDSTKYQATIF